MWILDFQYNRHLARDGTDDFDDTNQRIILGELELYLTGFCVELCFFEGTDEVLVPPLDTFRLLRQLGVQHHLDFASAEGIARQCRDQ